MKMKTSELKGAALDWAVDVAEDGHCHKVEMISDYILGRNEGFLSDGDYIYGDNWANAGPIIQREKINVVFRPGDKKPGFWDAYCANTPHGFSAPTPLIAAMRCYVASKLGDEVEIPEELI